MPVSACSFKARDKSQTEMAALQQHSEKEKAVFEGEFKDLGDLIKNQQTALEQLRLKQFDRANDTITASSFKDAVGGGELMDGPAWSGTKDKNVPLSQVTP